MAANPTTWTKGTINAVTYTKPALNPTAWIPADEDPSSGTLLLQTDDNLLLQTGFNFLLQ